jgi:preprotein translocase subunit SecD
MQKQRWVIGLIFVLVVAAIAIIVTLPPQLGLDLKGGAQLTIEVQPTKERATVTGDDLAAVQKVIENRINALGVSEPLVQTVGERRILVQLPGVTDPEQAERILGGTAKLEFRAQKQGSEQQLLQDKLVQQQLKAQLASLRQDATKNADKISEIQEAIKKNNAAIAQSFEPAELTGKNLKNAQPSPTQGNAWEVAISFDGEGGEKFAQITKKLAGTGRSLGIFLDNELISDPVVDVQFAAAGITGGNAVITGRYTAETATDLAVQLRGGSLPFPVAIVENRTVGATLGQDSIRRSIYAGIAGLILVLIFMGVYYRLPGLIADVSLIIYALLTFACFALIGVTLTLPGIAGFILSIGMAVDANVLIFERTREEIRAGNTLYRSVESGFFRAFSSILDSNVTTIIACVALAYFGSGLVRGFAVTLAIGVLVSMFTALTCSRTFLLLVVLGVPGIRQKPELFCPDVAASVPSKG